MSAFKYLGRVLTAGDDDWLAVVGNLGKARKSWGWLSWILIREGADQKGVGKVFQGGGTGAVSVWVGYMGPHSEDGAGPVQFPKQGRTEDHWEATTETGIQELRVPASGGGNGGSGFRGDQKVGHTEAEHGRGVYCDATNFGPL